MEDGLVDVSMAAFAQQLLIREIVGGGLKVAVEEMLNLDRFVGWWVMISFGIGGGGLGVGH